MDKGKKKEKEKKERKKKKEIMQHIPNHFDIFGISIRYFF